MRPNVERIDGGGAQEHRLSMTEESPQMLPTHAAEGTLEDHTTLLDSQTTVPTPMARSSTPPFTPSSIGGTRYDRGTPNSGTASVSFYATPASAPPSQSALSSHRFSVGHTTSNVSPAAAAFQSPGGRGVRYSLAEALSSPSVQRKQDTEATVFAPVQGTGKMFDESRGSVLIEDYDPSGVGGHAAHNHTGSVLKSSLHHHSSSSFTSASTSLRSSSPSIWHDGAAPFDQSSHSVAGDALGALGGVWNSLVSGVLRPFATTPNSNSAPGQNHVLYVPSPTNSPSPQPGQQPHNSRPGSRTISNNVAVVDGGGEPAAVAISSENPPAENDAPISSSDFVPFPSNLSPETITSFYDPALTARGDRWRALLDPGSLRRRFAQGMYLKLLRAGRKNLGGASIDEDSPEQNDHASASPTTGTSVATLSVDPSAASSVPTPILPPSPAMGDDSEYSSKIRKDLFRTFPSSPLFADKNVSYGRRVMYNILLAYSSYDLPVGYSQGMAFIVGMLQLHYGTPYHATLERGKEEGRITLETPKSPLASVDPISTPGSILPLTTSHCPELELEEQLFWSFLQLMHSAKWNLRSIYTDDCVGLKTLLGLLDSTIAQLEPELHTHLKREGVETSLYATQWFCCVFSYRFPLPFASNVWDNFLHHGLIFLLQMAVQLLRYTKASILSKSFEQIVPFLTQLPQLPSDLPDVAFAEVDVPQSIQDKLMPHKTTVASYKNRTWEKKR